MSKTVLHIGKYYPPFMGGIETFMAELLPQINVEEYTQHALVHHHTKNKSYAKEIINQVSVYRVKSYGQLFFAPLAPGYPIALNTLIDSIKPDLLHIHMPNTSAFWCLLNSKARKIPWIIHWHADVIGGEANTSLKLLYPFYRPFEQLLLKNCRAIICTSPDYMEHSKALKKWQHKCHIIPLGIRISDKPPIVKESILWPKGKKRLLAIGRLTYYKGFKYLIEAVKNLDDIALFIVGSGELQDQLQQQIEQLKLQDRVFLAGRVDQQSLNYLKYSCDIFCMPSIEKTEAFGMVLLEMMQAEKPIIVSRVSGSGMNWVVEENKSALFCNIKDSNDLAKKIEQLLISPELAKTLTKNAIQRLNSNFSIDSIARKTEALYHKVLNNC